MNVADLQTAIGTPADGKWGPASRAALLAHFADPSPMKISTVEMQAIAERLGCSLKQLAAVAAVESSGDGFDRNGRPKILYERHIFHRLTGGNFSPASFSRANFGGYNEDSWAKLADAAGRNPDAAFSSCSWGRFQVMGMHWKRLGYASAFALASACIGDEVGHFDLLARFIEANGLKDELRRLSSRPEDCAPFARAYNGPEFARFSYDKKLARAMA